MRIFNIMASFLMVFVLTFSFTACGDAAVATDATTETAAETPHGEGKEFTSAYVCPMHCTDSGSDTAGECPKCGMAYVAQGEHTEDGHNH